MKFRREKSATGDEVTISTSYNVADLSSRVGEYAEAKLIRGIVEELAKDWIQMHGADLLDKISPDDVEKALKTALAEKILK